MGNDKEILMEHQCNKESDIEEIKTDVKAILKILNGNGDLGMCAKVSILWGSTLFLITGLILTAIRVFIG